MEAADLEKRFEFLDHTADVYVAAYGKDLKEAFENAACATFETMTDVKNVTPKVKESVEVEGHDEKELLYNWLEALLVKFDITGTLYSTFKITSIDESPNRLRLKASIWGEPFNPKKHISKVGIKAITYHQMEIIKKPNAATIRFILDV